MVGWVRLKVRGRAGQKIMVRHGEMLNPNGTLYTSNLRGANATDVYYLRGDGDRDAGAVSSPSTVSATSR